MKSQGIIKGNSSSRHHGCQKMSSSGCWYRSQTKQKLQVSGDHKTVGVILLGIMNIPIQISMAIHLIVFEIFQDQSGGPTDADILSPGAIAEAHTHTNSLRQKKRMLLWPIHPSGIYTSEWSAAILIVMGIVSDPWVLGLLGECFALNLWLPN